jgi:hypothetical protein
MNNDGNSEDFFSSLCSCRRWKSVGFILPGELSYLPWMKHGHWNWEMKPPHKIVFAAMSGIVGIAMQVSHKCHPWGLSPPLARRHRSVPATGGEWWGIIITEPTSTVYRRVDPRVKLLDIYICGKRIASSSYQLVVALEGLWPKRKLLAKPWPVAHQQHLWGWEKQNLDQWKCLVEVICGCHKAIINWPFHRGERNFEVPMDPQNWSCWTYIRVEFLWISMIYCLVV